MKRGFIQIPAFGVFLIGTFNLCGYIFGIPVEMALQTCIGFTLTGTCLLMLSTWIHRKKP